MKEDKKTLLLVEDDFESQRYMEVLLKQQYALLYAESADEGRTLLDSKSIDLILMDISLRGSEDGLDLTRQLRRDPRFSHLPIIAVTAHAFPRDQHLCLQAGCDAYFSKPFSQGDLLRAIRDLLHQAN
ncbi:MAG: hypothetical protein C0600_11650 [Ignavibacteria bacterium]|mgnify:CR=1 FL=1|nr:MAG: hypothetical protein C0600_11650 [Ignavibacteria bacterium]